MPTKSKSVFAQKIDAILVDVHRYLKPMGYRKQARTFNRVFADGLVHAINFQMGEYPNPIGNHVEFLPYKPYLYSYFTVNLGVFIPEIYKIMMEKEPPKFVAEYKCEIRKRLGGLATGQDTWWNLNSDKDELSDAMLNLLQQHGLPYLNQFVSRQAIIQYWEHLVEKDSSARHAILSIAIMLNAQGNMERAKELLQKLRDDNRGLVYAEYVKNVGLLMGINLSE